MRKSMKVHVILPLAALFTIGVSMTSFALGWTERDGAWVYVNKDGSMAANRWEKSDNNWYWLNSDGRMAVDQIVEDDDDYYYVDENGVMVTNQWVQVENENPQEDEPSNWWYYFQKTGKACKANDSGNTTLKTINNKKYAFTDEGKMLFGWVDDSSTRQTDEDAWTNCQYYLGDENDGAVTIGWAQIHVIDRSPSWDEEGEESEDQDYWFYFQKNGKKFAQLEDGLYDDPIKIKTINGKRYGFDKTGRMVFEWSEVKPLIEMNESGVASASSYGYQYFNDRDNGARVTKGRFKVIPDPNINQKDFDDGDARWYYAYRRGIVCSSEFRMINGKRYAFDNSGRMLTGLQYLYIDRSERGNPVMYNKKLDDEDFLKAATELQNAASYRLSAVDAAGDEYEGLDILTVERGFNKITDYGVYYFGGDDDGAARTSTQTIHMEGEPYTFYFKEPGSNKGKGLNGIKNNYIYQNGKRVKADKDNKYEAYYCADSDTPAVENGDDSDIVAGHFYYVSPDELEAFANKHTDRDNPGLYLVNTSGNLVKGTKEVRDGNDMYYHVTNGKVDSYYGKDGSEKVNVVTIKNEW